MPSSKFLRNEWSAFGVSGVLASVPVMLCGQALELPWAIQHKCSSCATIGRSTWLICMCEGQGCSSIQTRALSQKASRKSQNCRTDPSKQRAPCAPGACYYMQNYSNEFTCFPFKQVSEKWFERQYLGQLGRQRFSKINQLFQHFVSKPTDVLGCKAF